MRVAVTAVNTYGQASATSSAIGPVQANAPINTTAPTVTGTPQRAYTLTATAGSWTGTGDTLAISGSARRTGRRGPASAMPTAQLQLGPADEGDTVRVLVTATNNYGVSSTPSAATQVIAPFPPANTTAPAVIGTAERGVTLNATQGTWTGPDNVYAFQWQRDAGEGYVNIAGATAATYTLGLADEGTTVRVVVTATDPDATVSQASAPTATVTDAVPVNQAPPTITGTVQRSSTLSAAVGTWAGIENVYAYQWQRSPDGTTWTDIGGATGSTYTVVLADEGDALRVLISAGNPDGTASAPSAATATVPSSPPAVTAVPTITGSAQRGVTLAGTRGAWNGPGNAYVYQWQRSVDGSTWTNIAGATGLSYTLTVADEGDFVRLSVTATNPDGAATATSRRRASSWRRLP